MPYTRTEAWLRFFGNIADRIKQDIGPASVLDAGCAKGFLVETLRDRGIEAYGVDVSAFAIQEVRPDIKPFCWVASVLDPFPRAYDLIVCIEVLEHLTPLECEQVVRNFCRASDDILFSSTPDDYREATHINVRPPEYWAGLFARQGFFRDIDFDATFVTAWAMRFRRAMGPAYRAVEAYERRLWSLNKECAAVRSFAQETRTQLGEHEQVIAQLQAQNAALQEGVGLTPDAIQCCLALQAEREARSQLTVTLNEVLSSPGWRFVVRAGQIRQQLFPAGSRRERWWLKLTAVLGRWLRI
ncbi:MAG: class I SAM-dependent methyltransferase [Chloroflexi bacterium]|nr:class I SAM-dependent methyltransferase [Chloroflexota bacterium]